MLSFLDCKKYRKRYKRMNYVDEAIVEEETEDRCTHSSLALNGRFNGGLDGGEEVRARG